MKIPPEYLVPRNEFVIPKTKEEAVALKEKMLEVAQLIDNYLGMPERDVTRSLKSMSYLQWKTGLMKHKAALMANYRLVKQAITDYSRRLSKERWKGYSILGIVDHLYETVNDHEDRMVPLRLEIDKLRDPSLMPRAELIERINALIDAFDYVESIGEEKDEDLNLHLNRR
jgi:hypothetical protein